MINAVYRSQALCVTVCQKVHKQVIKRFYRNQKDARIAVVNKVHIHVHVQVWIPLQLAPYNVKHIPT